MTMTRNEYTFVEGFRNSPEDFGFAAFLNAVVEAAQNLSNARTQAPRSWQVEPASLFSSELLFPLALVSNT